MPRSVERLSLVNGTVLKHYDEIIRKYYSNEKNAQDEERATMKNVEVRSWNQNLKCLCIVLTESVNGRAMERAL